MAPKSDKARLDPLKPGSGSAALARRGDRTIQGGESLRKRSGTRPSTERALVLRNKRLELQSTYNDRADRVFGQEKLELIAEDIMKSAVRAPFNLQKLFRIADSQLDFHVSQIKNMRDPDFFYLDIVAEVESRSPPDSQGVRTDLTSNAAVVADSVAYRVHNVYVLASSWKLACLLLEELGKRNVPDATLSARAKSDPTVRAYLNHLYEIFQNIMALELSCVRTLAMASKHYAPYFKQQDDGTISFDNGRLKELYKSYVDSIIVELIVPSPRYPLQVLLACLTDSLDEAPKDDKRFPQAMWDAMGDLTCVVQCLDMVEAPLQELPPSPLLNSSILQRFREAQRMSMEVASHTDAYRPLAQPLNKLKTKKELDRLWLEIEKCYKDGTGVELDHLFELTNDRFAHGQWSYDYPKGLPLVKEEQKKKPKQIKNYYDDEDDDDGGMPDLLTVSDSSNRETDDDTSEDEGEYDNDSDYGSDDEDHLRNIFRAAMDLSSANPEMLDPEQPEPNEAKSNSFLRALRHLRGRLFSGDPMLTPDGKPRKAFSGTKQSPRAPSKATPAPQEPTFMKATVEEVEDEDAPRKKKKKKKPKKKKKKSKATDSEIVEGEGSEGEEVATPVVVETPASPAVPKTPTKAPPKEKVASPKPPPQARSAFYGAGGALASSASLISDISGDSAQSARSYLKSEKLLDEKVKVKSRPQVQPQPAAVPEPKPKEGFFNKLLKKIPLKQKHKDNVSKLLGSDDPFKGKTAMKWDQFLKLMADLGFSYEGGTAGSSVRFDPPDPKDKSITIHKPHPDSTLQPHMVKKIGKRLKDRYSWTVDQFVFND